ncbi:hypothetical protein A6X21_01345 [Planctopirus hydrillae]|uniref:Uncharacterized protein n=1 Tax=Planctopirus hydrillae TaxID=1841610 RepID=A0A1C3E4U9_9PLAN|nr:hypothetical protein A6X21_01345 [Planctopirus hydrillae]
MAFTVPEFDNKKLSAIFSYRHHCSRWGVLIPSNFSNRLSNHSSFPNWRRGFGVLRKIHHPKGRSVSKQRSSPVPGAYDGSQLPESNTERVPLSFRQVTRIVSFHQDLM